MYGPPGREPTWTAAPGCRSDAGAGARRDQAHLARRTAGLLAGFSPLAGVSAGTAAVLFVFGVLCLAWHQVSGHVSLAITVVAYVVMSAVAVAAAAGAWLAVLWVAHRHRNPELLVRRPASVL